MTKVSSNLNNEEKVKVYNLTDNKAGYKNKKDLHIYDLDLIKVTRPCKGIEKVYDGNLNITRFYIVYNYTRFLYATISEGKAELNHDIMYYINLRIHPSLVTYKW